MSRRRDVHVACAIGMSSLFIPAHIVGAVQASAVPAEPTCTQCSVALVPVVRLGHLEDPAGVGSTAQVARSGSGWYAVSSYTFPGEVLVYDSSGQMRRVVGRRGEGPGEFSGEVQLAFDSSDSLHVIALDGSRYSVFTPTFEHARSIALPATIRGFCMGSEETLFAVGVEVVDSMLWRAHV